MKRLVLVCVILAMSIGRIQALDNILQSDSIQEVVITGTRSATDIRHLSQTVNVIDRRSIEESNRTSLLPLLSQQVPGLFVTQRGFSGYGVAGGAAGNISMRGLSSSSSQMLVLIDGHPNYSGIYGHSIADSYQSLMTERVEVLRGPASLLYGSNAMGGVMNIVTRKEQSDGTHASLHAGAGSFGTVETEFSSSTKYKRLSSMVSGSYNRTDGHRKEMGFEQYGGYARMGYELSNRWKIWGNVDVTRFIASQPGPMSAPLVDADQEITRGTSALGVENKHQRTEGGVSLFYSWGDHWINDGHTNETEPKQFRFISYDAMLGASAWQSANLFTGNRLTVGMDYYRYAGKAHNRFVDGPQKGTDQLQVNRYEEEIAGYVEMRQIVGSWLTLNGGIRTDHHFTVGTEFVPQFGAAFHLNNGSELKLSASKGFRYPTLKEMFMYPPQNPNLQAELLWNYELAYTQTMLSGHLNYGINLFHIDADNIILTLPAPNGMGMLNQNSGELQNSGIELQAAYNMTKSCTINANYSWLRMKNPVIGAPEHKAYVGGSYRKKGLHIMSGVEYINGLYSQVGPNIKESFAIWNANLSYSLSPMVQIWLNAQNLLNTQYQINNDYPMPGIAFMTGVNLSISQ